jgi:hypothetical protein
MAARGDFRAADCDPRRRRPLSTPASARVRCIFGRTRAGRPRPRMSEPNPSSLLWSTADLLRGDYKQSDYGKVIDAEPKVVTDRIVQMILGLSQ